MLDTVRLVEGSFNWLSARRDSLARQERSIAYSAQNLSEAKEQLLKTLDARRLPV